MASLLLPFLHCPLCSSQLTAPVTLFCGHTLCAKHVSFPAHPPSVSPQLLRLTPCPLQSCTISPTAPTPINVSSSSRVTVYPAVGQSDDHAAAFATISVSRTDTTVNKLAMVIHRYDQLRKAQSTQRLPDVDSGSGTDSQTDEEILDARDPSPTQAFTASSCANPTEGPSSIPRQVSSDGPQPAPARMSARKRRRKRLPPPRRLDAPAQSADQFEKELLAELTCEICLTLLYQPVTSTCQHTFCLRCLHRSLDHGTRCPICREVLPGFSYFQDHPYNQTILSIILRAFPEAYAERQRVIEQEERHSRLDTPIFVCQLSFPGLPTVLHFYEPRYRLMLRRCVQNPDACFGMIMPMTAAGGRSTGNDFGTMLKITGIRQQNDGRFIVETRGTYRFRILERDTLDGYLVARIERILDYPSLHPDVSSDAGSIPPPFPQNLGAEAAVQTTQGAASSAVVFSTVSEPGALGSYAREVQILVDECRAFLAQIQRGAAPWVVQRLNRLSAIHGPMPNDPADFSFWMAMALPIEDTEKAKLLPVKSPLLRLRLVVHWIEQLNNHWWFTNGCIVS